MRVLTCLAALAAVVILAGASSASAEENAHKGDAARGKYLVGIMGCNDCHTPGYFMGNPDMTKFLGGADIGFALPGLGYFYGPNLTPHEKGLATWSEDDIVAAIRTGARPDGRMLAPLMPWPAFAGLTDEDAYSIAAYLKTLTPVDRSAPPPTGWGETPPGPYLAVTMPPGAEGDAPTLSAYGWKSKADALKP